MKIAQILFVFTGTLYAYQGPIPPPPSGPPPPGLPINDFVVFLFILGVVYGAKKCYNLTKTNPPS